MGEDDETMKMQTAALQREKAPKAPAMDGLPTRGTKRIEITAPRLSPISLPSGSPTSPVRMGESWRDYATAKRDFDLMQSALDTSRASLASMYRDLTG